MSAAVQRRAPGTLPEWMAGLLDVGDEGPLWLVSRRREAAAALKADGLPTRHWEGWQFTPLGVLEEVRDWVASEPEVSEVPAGVEIVSVADLIARDPSALDSALGTLTPLTHPLAALNLALLRGGVVVRIEKGAHVETPIEIVHTAVAGLSTPYVFIDAGEGSQAVVVERFVGDPACLTLPVAEVVVGPGAVLDHVRVQEHGTEVHHFGHLTASVERDGNYRSRVMTLGAKVSRLDLVVRLDAPGAQTTLDGLYLTGDGQQHDHITVVDHRKPHTTSIERYKGILDGKSRAIFDGTIYVRRDAQKSNGAQENRNLLLSDDAVVNTKPHLEIDADDVKCSHGATVGRLDPDQLFYLRARGIDAQSARSILVYAFAREVVDRIPVKALRERISATVLARLPEGEALGELG